MRIGFDKTTIDREATQRAVEAARAKVDAMSADDRRKAAQELEDDMLGIQRQPVDQRKPYKRIRTYLSESGSGVWSTPSDF
jgi:hypothetical protein